MGSLRRPLLAMALVGALAGCTAQGGYGGYGGYQQASADACQGVGMGTILGGLVGGGAGGLLGNQIGPRHGRNVAATIAGSLIGAAAGAYAGNQIESSSCERARQAQSAALSQNTRIGQTITWTDPQTNASGTFTPVRDGRSAAGQFCREFQQTIVIGGETKQGVGTACQNPDGSWRIVS